MPLEPIRPMHPPPWFHRRGRTMGVEQFRTERKELILVDKKHPERKGSRTRVRIRVTKHPHFPVSVAWRIPYSNGRHIAGSVRLSVHDFLQAFGLSFLDYERAYATALYSREREWLNIPGTMECIPDLNVSICISPEIRKALFQVYACIPNK